MGDIYSEVGERIRARRLHLELTLEDLSELSGLHTSYIGQIERGVKKSSLRTVSVLAAALGVLPGKLFSAVKKPKEASSQKLEAATRGSTPKELVLILNTVKTMVAGLRRLRS